LGDHRWFQVQADVTEGRTLRAVRVTAGTLDGTVVIAEDIEVAGSAPAGGGAFASPPYANAVDEDRFVVGFYDGSASHLVLGSVADRSLHEILRTDAYVIHHAVLSVDGRSAYAALADVKAATPAETGIWRIDIATGRAIERLTPPLEPPSDRLRGFFERLSITPDGRRLVAWRCGRTCALRVVDLATGVARRLGGEWPTGPVAGLTDDAIFAADEDCPSNCAWQRISLATGEATSVGVAPGSAVVATSADGFGLVHEILTPFRGGRYDLSEVDLATGATSVVLAGDEARLALVPAADTYGVAVPVGTVLLGPDGQLAPSAGRTEDPDAPFPTLLDLATGQLVQLMDLRR
jgi:dipeptidyl aminopeptidase/acylaminoacyl peptidase